MLEDRGDRLHPRLNISSFGHDLELAVTGHRELGTKMLVGVYKIQHINLAENVKRNGITKEGKLTTNSAGHGANKEQNHFGLTIGERKLEPERRQDCGNNSDNRYCFSTMPPASSITGRAESSQ